jgi:hypothetical protein
MSLLESGKQYRTIVPISNLDQAVEVFMVLTDAELAIIPETVLGDDSRSSHEASAPSPRAWQDAPDLSDEARLTAHDST